jgi:membrane fusion protein, multidrug efflux system
MNKRRIIKPLALAAVLAATGLAAYHFYGPNRAAVTGKQRGGAGTGIASVPITTAPVQVEDFAIRSRTIGILETLATVIVKSRIESQVTEQHVKDGQFVKKGDLLFTLDDREVRATIGRDEAQLQKDQATLERTAADLERYQRLIQSNAAARQQLDQAIADHKSAQATVEADQAQLRTDNLRLGYTKIEAPIDGRVGAVRVTPGNLISVNDSTGLLTITQIAPIRVAFTLPERDFAALRNALTKSVPAAVRVYTPGANDALATGQLDFVDSSVDSNSGTIAAKAVFANESLELWPGMYVDVEVDLDVRPKTALIPAVAIQSSQRGPFVFVANTDQRAEMRVVQVIAIDGNRAALRIGVKEGERVIVEGQMRLVDGARVTEVSSPAGDRKGDTANAVPDVNSDVRR